jgi:hypothetical protein
MNDDITQSRGRWRGWLRRTGILAVAAGIALLASGCGGGSSSDGSDGSSSTGGPSSVRNSVAYTDCLRSHGMDVNIGSGGALTADNPNGTATPSAQQQAAFNACRHLAPAVHLSQAQQEQDLEQMLNYVACMRKHGEPDMPDPSTATGGVAIPLSGINPKSSQFQAAQQACQSIMRAVAPAGAGGNAP